MFLLQGEMMRKILFVLLFLVVSLWAKVDINTATAKELSVLKGIGMKKAEAIVAYRNDNGSFASVEELLKVKGIGAKILEKIKPEVEAK